MVVSVIMNSLNEKREYLLEAIASYINQQGVEVDLIISMVEGDSNIDYLKKNAHNFPRTRITIMNRASHPISKGIKSPQGSFLQLNHALPLIKGDWFCFASSNDIAYPRKLISEVELSLLYKREVCYSAFDYITETGTKIRTQGFHEYDFKKHLVGNFVSDCALISRRLVDKYLPFKIELNNYAYWDLWLRIFEGEGNVFTYNANPTWGYRQDPNSMHIQRRKSPEQIAEANRDRETMLKLHR